MEKFNPETGNFEYSDDEDLKKLHDSVQAAFKEEPKFKKEPQTPEQLAGEMAKAEQEKANPRANKAFVGNLIARMPTGPDALKPVQLIKQRVVSFVFDGSLGAPGIFCDDLGNYLDVEIWCRSLSTVDELEALQGVSSEIAAPYALAKKGLFAIEGTPIHPEMVDFIWEAIGPVGRQLVIMASQTLGNVSQSALGKYRSSFTVH